MATAGNGAGQFRIDISPHVAERVKGLNGRAESRGTGPQFRTALRQVVDRLRTEAPTLGEAQYPLRQLGLVCRVVVQPPIAVYYSVSANLRLVWITDVRLLG